MKFIVFCLIAAIWGAFGARGQNTEDKPGSPALFRVFHGFKGDLQVMADAKVVSVPITIHRFILNNGTTVTNLGISGNGWTLVHLAAGELRIAREKTGKSLHEGAFLTYPPGAPIYFQTEDDSAIIDVVVVIVPKGGTQRPQQTPAIITPSEKTQYTKYAKGILHRPGYRGPIGDFVVEFWDMLIGPGQYTEQFSLPGGAVVEVRSGKGVVTTEKQKQELELGRTWPVAENNQLQLRNSNQDRPLILRVILLRRVAP